MCCPCCTGPAGATAPGHVHVIVSTWSPATSTADAGTWSPATSFGNAERCSDGEPHEFVPSPVSVWRQCRRCGWLHVEVGDPWP